jgi:hypothetical protein
MVRFLMVKIYLCHEDIRGSENIVPSFLNSAVDGGEWPASRSDRFSSGERAPGTH